MDPNIPRSFTSLLDGDDSPQIGANRTNPITPTDPHMTYPSYPPHDYNQHIYQPYYPRQLQSMNVGGTPGQPPRNSCPPYYPPPHNNIHNMHHTEYPYYPTYYPPPHATPSHLSAGSNCTPSSTPTRAMAGLGNSETEVDPNTEGDVEEVQGGASMGAKKWTVEEDQRLIRAWINIGTDPIVGNDQKKSGFWARVATNFNDHRPQGASIRTWKTLNGRWLHCSPLVSKWAGIMSEVERMNQSGWNEVMILEAAHKLYKERTGKKFDLEHWYEMLKGQPKWMAICDPPKSGSGSSKRSHHDTEDTGEEGVGGSERPEGRKAAKRRLKQATNTGVIDLVTTRLDNLSNKSNDMSEMFKNYLDMAKEEKAQKMMMREEKLRAKEDIIMMTDTSMMDPAQAGYYAQRKADIIARRSRQSSSSH